MAEFLGWFNVSLAAAALSLFLLRRYRKYFIKSPNKSLNKLLKYLSKIHPFIGITLVVSGLIHGYMALGTFRLHTGYITWFALLIMLATRILGSATKSKRWIYSHRAAAVLFVAALAVHLLARNII